MHPNFIFLSYQILKRMNILCYRKFTRKNILTWCWIKKHDLSYLSNLFNFTYKNNLFTFYTPTHHTLYNLTDAFKEHQLTFKYFAVLYWIDEKRCLKNLMIQKPVNRKMLVFNCVTQFLAHFFLLYSLAETKQCKNRDWNVI